ncbi:vascular-related unknown protein 1 [Cucumis sativus]|uniref:Uncharacterized protein n=1 Tax=Cucumis sativus TaxID=3659 RepID=A0A0A0LQF7_CUCSA|nr:vascular-related unknown protein 1 [Cucumis sativus]KGN63264.1 hypothetical protein Csa_022464 [Cucumis sativus]
MEKSVYSSAQQFPHPLPSFPSSALESGWTAYLDSPSDDDTNTFPTSSLLSDAASHAVAAALPPTPLTNHLRFPTKLILKPKQPHLFVDTSLEDTASSPDNSPKVGDHLGPFDGNHYRRKSSLGNGEKYRDHERRLEISFKRKASEYTDLKKRGLCLVPLSMLTNYLD